VLGFTPQRENAYNKFLPHSELQDGDSSKFLAELRKNFAQCLLGNDITNGCVKWTINLHKYIILYGLKMSKTDHVFFVRIMFDLLTTPSVDTVSADKFAKVLSALLKKKYLLSRKDLILDWKPLFELYEYWEDSSLALRGLLKPAPGFKSQLKIVIKWCRNYWSEEATQEMLDRWRPMLCPHDRSMAIATKYLSLFLPTTKDIPPEKTWKLWLPELTMFWNTWGNSPNWEVDLMKLYSRLALHQVGVVDWEPHMSDLYTRFMASFNLPVTYGGSGVRIKLGLALGGNNSLASITRWIVSSIGGGSSSQGHLDRLLVALESYYHPANANGASDSLHSFVSLLCHFFIKRAHVERYNTKWASRVADDKKLTDQDILHFVTSLKPIAFHVLHNANEDLTRNVFNCLATLAPDKILPELLEKLHEATNTLTEPHKFTVCVQALSSCAGPLLRNYPAKCVDLLTMLLPGIDVNDIWKSTDTFVLMSDLLESMPVADQSHLSPQADSDRLLASKTAVMETFVIEFMNRVFTLIENTSRENIRPDTAKPDDYLSDEEVAADAAINETFLKIVANSSPDIFKIIFSQLQKYLRGKIVEPTVAGGILASMCKSVVLSYPEQGLAFFVPYLTQCVRTIMIERPHNFQSDSNKIDEELLFHLQLLSEVISVKGAYLYRNKGSFILPYVSSICDLLDSTIDLPQKDEYEMAQSILQSLLTYVVQVRLMERHPRVAQSVQGWGRTVSLDELDVEWYKPGKEEMEVIKAVIERYMVPRLEALDQWAGGTKEMDKETLLRTMRCVYRQLHSISELLPPVQVTEWESVLSTGLSWLKDIHITLPNGDPIRQTVSKLMGRIQRRILKEGADDTDSLAAVITIHDVLLFSYGNDEEDINDHIDEHRIIKQHRLNRLVGSKLHLNNVHLDRISIQWESQIWLKNLLVQDSLPPDTVSDLLDLCTEKYSETRILSQELLLKVVARVGRSCHPMILPRLLSCLQDSPSVSHEMMKGALYVLNSEKHMFFYSWEAASKLWPALVNAQHSDKSSVDEILRDISIKVNRYYQDYSLYTLPVSTPTVPTTLLDLVRSHPDLPHSQMSSLDSQSLGSLVHCQSLETSLHQLVVGKGLHWRHNQMAVGMLLSMVTFDHTPSHNQVAMWLNLLLDDDRTIRLMAYQALEGIIKLVKLTGQKVPLADLIPEVEPEGPGLREDNEWLQYRADMEPAELETYWGKPFLVKSYMGYWAWGRTQKDKARLPHKPSVYQLEPESIRSLISQFFLDEGTVARFVELNSLEHEKGEDFFNMDRGLFLSFMFENIGPKLACVFQPYIERLVGSPEESQQRAAAEMMYGLVRGSRFWDFKSAEQLWSWLLPVFQQVLNNVTTETQSDWDFCFAGLSNKADPNRLRWLFELLVTQDNLVSQGAFKESSYLLFVGKCLSQNWRVRELYCRTYNILKEHWAHPYNNVRHQIASTLATLLAMDIPVVGAKPGWNVGKGFPTKKLFIDEVLPKLNLNFHNPEFSDCSREDSPVSTVGAQSNGTNGSSDDVSMSMDVEDEETRRANHTLETVSLWICHQIRVSSVSLQEEMFQILPYLCQFIGTERDQDVSQSCLQALCYLSACILPAKVVPTMLDMVRRIASSSSYKTKISMLEYLQVAVFTNFPALACNKEYVSQVQQLVVSLLQDDNLTVRQKAAKILGGLLHSGFLNGEAVPNLLADLRGRVRDRMKRHGKKFTREQGQEDKGRALQHHSGILGMCAFVEAFPYDVPKFVPPILMELSTHLNDPQPIPMTIKKSLQEFKRTHQDNWQEHKRKFTEDQLVVMTDLLVSQNYYA